MKKVILFTILGFLIAFSGNSQSIDALDAKNGYKDFKIGDPFEKYNGKIVFRDYLNNDQSRPTYSVNKEFIYSDLYGYPIQAITLTFKDNVLKMIDIWLKEIVPEGVVWSFDPNVYEYISNKFNAAFGEQYIKTNYNNDSGLVFHREWRGKKVELWVNFVFRGTMEGGHYIKVTVIDAPMLKRSNSEF